MGGRYKVTEIVVPEMYGVHDDAFEKLLERGLKPYAAYGDGDLQHHFFREWVENPAEEVEPEVHVDVPHYESDDPGDEMAEHALVDEVVSMIGHRFVGSAHEFDQAAIAIVCRCRDFYTRSR